MLLAPRPPKRTKPEPWPWTWAALAEPYASIAKSCTFLLPMWETGGDQRCLVTRTLLTRQTGTTNGASPYGPALTRTAGTLDHLIGPAGFQPIANPNAGYTIFGVANPAASTVAAGSGTLFLMRRTVPYIQYGIMFNFDAAAVEGTSGALTAYQEQTSNTRFNATAASMVNGQWHSFASRLSGSTVTAWRDGVLVATNTSGPTTTLVDAAQILCIGGLNASGYGTIGGIAIVAAFDRPLADWEMQALNADPMGLIRQAPTRTLFIPDSIAAKTGTSGSTLPKLTTTSGATFSIPARTAVGTSTLPKLGSGGVATRLPVPVTAQAASTLPKLGAGGIATKSAPGVTATSAATLPKFGGTAAATRAIPDRTAQAGGTLPKLGGGGAATRTAPPLTAQAGGTLPKLGGGGTASLIAPTARPALGRTSVLNAAHPVAGRLIHGYVFTEGSGTTRDLVQTSVVSASAQGGAAWVTNAGGAAISTATGWIDSGLTIAMPQSPLHIVVGVRNITSNDSEGQQAIVSNTLDGGTYTNAGWPFAWFYNSTTAWVIDANAAFSGGATGSYDEWPEAAASVYTAGPHHFHMASEAAGTTIYHNGTSLGTFGTVIPGTTPQPLLFGGNQNGWQNFRAQYDYVYIFSGTLTTAEINSLRADPYALVTAGTPGPTRFYLPSTGTAPISPAFDSAWDDTSSVVTRPTSTVKGTSAFAEVTDTEGSASNTWDVCLGRFISGPLQAQTLSGTIKAYIRARENVTGLNARSQIVVRVVSNDGSTVRGTLYGADARTVNESEWVITTTATSARNARFPTTQAATAVPSLTSVTVQAGDRIVIEVGGRAVNTATTSTFTFGMRFGENATDLAENETGTTEGAPWVEFSQGIGFANTAGSSDAALPKLGGAASGTYATPSRTAQSAATLPKLGSVAAGTTPSRTASSTATLPKFTAAATLTVVAGEEFTYEFTDEFDLSNDVRFADSASSLPRFGGGGSVTTAKPQFNATSAALLPKLGAGGSATAARPQFNAASAATLPKLSASGSVTATKPQFNASGAATLPKLGAGGIVSAAVPSFSGTAAATLPKLGASAVAVRTIPARTASSSALLRLLTSQASGTTAVPIFSGSAAAALPKLGASGSAARGIPPITATSASLLPRFSALASAVRLPPDKVGQSAATLPKLGASALAVRTIPDRTATSSATLRLLTSGAVGAAAVPGVSGASAATLPRLGASGSAARTVPNFTATSATTLPRFAALASAVRLPPDKTAQSAATLPKLGSVAQASRSVPGFTAQASGIVPRLGAAAQVTRTAPQFGATATGALPKLSASAGATTAVPQFAAAASGVLPKFGALASAVRTIPNTTASSAATLPKLGTSASATRTIPVGSAISAATLPRFSALAAAVRTIPARTAASAATLPKLGGQAAGSAQRPNFAASSTATLPKFGALSSATLSIPARAATSAATLRKLGGSATAQRVPPPLTAQSAATLPKLGAAAVGQRLPIPVTSASAATLPLFRTMTSAIALAPGFAGVGRAILPRFGTAASGVTTVPHFVADAVTALPRFGARASAFQFSPQAADIVVVERFTARLRRSEAVTAPVHRTASLSAHTARTAKLTAKMRTP